MSDKDKKIEPQDSSLKDTSSETDLSQQDTSDKDADKSVSDAAFGDAGDKSGKNSDIGSEKKASEKKSDSGNNGSKPPQNGNTLSAAKPIKWFVFFIILAAIAYAIYFGWQKWQTYEANMQKANRVEQIQQQLTAQQRNFDSAISGQKQQLQALANKLEENKRYVGQLQEQLRTTQRKVQAQNSDKQNEWLFNEAEYLIREASYKLNFTDDAASIIALLQAADSQLAELNDSSLTQLRQAISQDINKVRASGNLDIEGVAIAIETLKTNVSELELASVQLDSEQTIEDSETPETDVSSWQHFKNSLSKAASKYYTVHHFDESAQPFISPQKARLLRENILLNLQTAQLAALQNNQTLYQFNLQDIKDWVSQYFKQKPANTQAFIQQLDELSNNSVELDLPSSLSSYQLISDISQQKVNRWLETETKPETKSESKPEAEKAAKGDEEEPSA